MEKAINFTLGFRAICYRLVFDKTEIPIAHRLGQAFHAGFNRDRRTGRQHLHAGKQRVIRNEILERHIFGKMRRVELGLEARKLHKGFDFRAEQQCLAVIPIIKRLNTEAISGQSQSFIGAIPNCEREHAVEFMDRFKTPFTKRRYHHFAITTRAEGMALRFQINPQFLKIINLTIISENQLTIGRRHRLMGSI